MIMSDTTRPRASVGSFGLFWPGFLLLFLFAACSSQLNDSAGAEPGPTVAIETADATATRPGHQVVRATALAERHGVRSIHLYEALEDERNLLGSFEAEDPGDLAPQAHLDFELPADRSVQLEVDAVNGAGSSSSNSF